MTQQIFGALYRVTPEWMKGEMIQVPIYNLNYTVKAKNITFSVPCQAGTSGKERTVDLEGEKSVAWKTAIAQYLQNHVNLYNSFLS